MLRQRLGGIRTGRLYVICLDFTDGQLWLLLTSRHVLQLAVGNAGSSPGLELRVWSREWGVSPLPPVQQPAEGQKPLCTPTATDKIKRRRYWSQLEPHCPLETYKCCGRPTAFRSRQTWDWYGWVTWYVTIRHNSQSSSLLLLLLLLMSSTELKWHLTLTSARRCLCPEPWAPPVPAQTILRPSRRPRVTAPQRSPPAPCRGWSSPPGTAVSRTRSAPPPTSRSARPPTPSSVRMSTNRNVKLRKGVRA